LDCICSTGAGEANESFVTSTSDCGANVKIGVRANSTVQWTDRGIAHSISVIETLYDWR
jgi:hypothetical protein